jgi:hypothetical protein
MVEVGELQRVAVKEHRGVVTDQIPVALPGVELDREPTDVPGGLCGTTLTRHRGEPDEQVSAFTHLGKHVCATVFGDVVGDGEGAVRPGALCVHSPLRDHLAIEVGQLLQEPHILEQHRPPAARGGHVVVVGDGRTGNGGEFLTPLVGASVRTSVESHGFSLPDVGAGSAR